MRDREFPTPSGELLVLAGDRQHLIPVRERLWVEVPPLAVHGLSLPLGRRPRPRTGLGLGDRVDDPTVPLQDAENAGRLRPSEVVLVAPPSR